ncbi:MAG: RsmB/NOP family class I SAM-dependent RNA methyltransferase [Candidatus Lokiarchaeota archaeon]|nr:RsmB/NOP family class I SAM-dependent RNA methyltransferase [Candidatus Lokiarchaeota archaeon]
MIESQPKNLIKKLFKLLYRFSSQESGIFDKEQNENPIIYHYYYEIIRYWNKINFIIKKNLRYTNKSLKLEQDDLPIYFYITYRVIWEIASISSILKDLNFYFKKKKEEEISIKSFLNGLKTFSLSKALINKDIKEILSIKLAIPSFFIDKLSNYMNLDFLRENLEAMNNLNNQMYTIWFNLNKIEEKNLYNQEFIINNLQQKGVKVLKDEQIKYLFHVNNRRKIIESEWFKRGYLSFQDKGSSAVIEILNARVNEYIYDMCAAPGMKTSLIAQKLNNKGKIIAVEFNRDRTKKLRKLLNHLNVKGVDLIIADSIDAPFKEDLKFDKILLDAPCSGSGTFKSNPELKWRQNSRFLNQNIILQEKLIASAIELLKPGGILVYSTCSLYAEEGELQISKFLDYLEPLNLPKWLSPSYKVGNKTIKGTGRLYPAKHKTQGFFIGKFKKLNNNTKH